MSINDGNNATLWKEPVWNNERAKAKTTRALQRLHPTESINKAKLSGRTSHASKQEFPLSIVLIHNSLVFGRFVHNIKCFEPSNHLGKRAASKNIPSPTSQNTSTPKQSESCS
jgi:hypothetical protein